MKIKIILFFTSLTATIASFAHMPALYLENHYGAVVTCIVNNSRQVPIQSNYNPIWLGELRNITSLTISTGYYGATSLKEILGKIIQAVSANPGKDAFLIVKPSGYLSNWDIAINWRSPNSTISSFSMSSPEEEAKTIERHLQLDKISPDVFFQRIELGLEKKYYDLDYAAKVRTLRKINYDALYKKYYDDLGIYAKLKKFGYPTLIDALRGIQMNYYAYLKNPNAQWTQTGNLTPDEARALIKKYIDYQFQLYLQYRKNGWVE